METFLCKKIIFLFSIVFSLVILVSFSAIKTPKKNQIFYTNSGEVSFHSEAAEELIDAQSNELRAIINVDSMGFSFVVRIESFDGFNVELQKTHFNENYMESSKFPNAIFQGKIIDEVDFSKDGVYVVRAKGVLNIHGVEKERIIKTTLSINNNIVTVYSKFDVLTMDHNIKIPRIVHDKIASDIIVEVKAALKKK